MLEEFMRQPPVERQVRPFAEVRPARVDALATA
jgi:hypothetical protein